MDRDKKMEMLMELDSTTDWEALVAEREQKMQNQADSQQGQASSRKLTKSQKKKLKMERQLEQVQETIQKKNVQTVVYNNPDSRARKSLQESKKKESESTTATSSTNKDDEPEGMELDMKSARHEIIKFGMSSLKAKDLEDAEESLAISLGAWPNKRKGRNYKELKAERKKAKEEAMEQETSMLKPNLKVDMKKKRPPVKGRAGAGGGAIRRKDKGKAGGGGGGSGGRNKKGRRY